ncbi:acyl-CoA synthetase/AMP-acid ligase-like protein II [Aureobasidium subglaciale]|nr:acyl-CoA synthetase/AMP-acid ligase-like protein II [Aureobasidium subglaciale]KAI5215037.1 acyl-CoA synthetase/AMP-acid ligase-like protein II [Aureobasidium subglaciale]KAI5218198.1 acyl-CoA synthetase/AMP-acid ligase-like protein II [Aureobasidium subglaciale]KAI5255885.1 acyl-CoA synthetase/AMP-acid ligase-like protein II [Aureobasidium subglaciale]
MAVSLLTTDLQVPLNPAFNALQITSALTHLAASHLIISAEINLPYKLPRSVMPLLAHLIPDMSKSKMESEAVPSLKRVIVVENSSGRIETGAFGALSNYTDVLRDGEGERLVPKNLDADEVVNIQFTSGTTSMPKAACLTHRSVLNNGKSIGDRMLLTHQDIVCCPPPLFHCFGAVLGYMATSTHGSAIVLPSESFNAEATLRAVQENAATALYGVPTMFISELELLASGVVPYEGFSQLRTGIAAGSSIPAALMRKLHDVLGLTQLTICYGMTETSPVSAMTTTDDPMWARLETVGKLLPHVEAKVVDPEGKILPPNVRGELAVAGYLVMKGYWGDEARTQEAIQADDKGILWMHTGDEASMDENGYVRITGRIKDLIIRGGENIHPLEIENAVLNLPFVTDVSVVGLPDPKYGEVVAAFIMPKNANASEEEKTKMAIEIKKWIKETLSPHLVPKYVFWSDGWPKTASGKIQKFKLRETGVELAEAGHGIYT